MDSLSITCPISCAGTHTHLYLMPEVLERVKDPVGLVSKVWVRARSHCPNSDSSSSSERPPQSAGWEEEEGQ